MNKIPSRSECLHLMRQYHMWDHVIQHSIKVADVALSLAKALNQAGERLDLTLIEAASLLHDIAKKGSIENGEDHVSIGAALLKDLGCEEVSEIVRYHVELPKGRTSSRITEAEVVNYADKRVLHDSIVTLNERFLYIRERYGNDESRARRITNLEEQTIKLEKKIFSKLDIKPSNLLNLE